MFNWFKNKYSTTKETAELNVTAKPDGDSGKQFAMPEYEILKNKGNVHLENDQWEDATVCYRQAIELKPDYAEAYTNLGFVSQAQGNPIEAIALYRKAVMIKPDLLPAHQNLGFILLRLGQVDDAEASLRRLIELSPDDFDALQNLGVIAAQRGNFTEAEIFLRRAIELKPYSFSAHTNLGIMFKQSNRMTEAEASYRRALKLQPDNASTHYNLGNLLQETGRLSDAEVAYRKAIELKPDYAEAHSNLGNTLHDLDQFDEAMASFRLALQFKPDLAKAHSNMLLAMQYAKNYSQSELFAEHLAYAQRFEEPVKKHWDSHTNSRELGKRLKIGYVSPDFRKHSVAYFIESVLIHHDPEQIEVYCYYNNATSDEVTLRLKSLVKHWRVIQSTSDNEVAQLIRNDGIDILVDLAGHTGENRLPVFAMKPAPVQASWLGYPGTSGLSAIDYRISDVYADPVAMSEHYYSETLYRLPSTTTCYLPPQPSPEVGKPPSLSQGHITFASFNNLTKVTPEVRILWAQILLATPDSRLLLKCKSLADMKMRKRLADEFSGYGITSERLILEAWDASSFEHLDRYNQVDIGLDPFPYNGVTTSFEALWMGVPVVSMTGNSYTSRMGVSILSNLGLTDLIADSLEDYVTISTRLAKDFERLAQLRNELRARMTDSPLADGKRFTLDIENAYHEMWQSFASTSGT
jgi:protein O-GlcNAc transferase